MRSLVLFVLLVPALAMAEPGPAVLLGAKGPAPAGPVATTLYINRCKGGCTITGGASDDASAMTSSIPCNGTATCGGGGCSCSGGTGGTFTIHEFTNDQGMTGTAADADWAALMQCIKEVYSPYGVKVTDVMPVNTSFNMGIAAGVPEDIGYSSNQIGGIAHTPRDCSPTNNQISFSFSNIYHGGDRINTMCYVVSQETGHAYGLEHEYEFVQDHSSACTDPMSYRQDCGGQRFFRNKAATCGENATRPCVCGGVQNSHQRVLAAAGPGTPITKPPTVSVASPTGGPVQNGEVVTAIAGAQRGIARLELWLNNWKWMEVPGVGWTGTGQPNPASYQLKFPANVPDGVIDLQVKAFDDIEVETDTAVIHVQKGQPCADASACAMGQKCDQGKCFWDPPTGMLGDSCTYNEFCTSNICAGTADKQICTQDCLVGATDACPMGYDCIMTNGVNGVCFTSTPPAGCCSTTDSTPWAPISLSAIALGLVLRRRRSR